MESITATGGKVVPTNQSKPATTLDKRILDLVNNKPWPHSEEKLPLDSSDVLPLMPMMSHPLLKTLAVLRSGGREQINVAEVPRTMKHDVATDPLHKTSKRSAGGDKTHTEIFLPLTSKARVEAPVIRSRSGEKTPVIASKAEAKTPVMVNKTGVETPLLTQLSLQQAAMPEVVQVNNPQPLLAQTNNPGKAHIERPSVSKTVVSERKRDEEPVMPALPGLQQVSHGPVQQAGDVLTVMSPRTSVLPQPAEVTNPLQSGLTYQFSRWGEGHTVTVIKNEGQIFTFRPSDTLVAQQLSQQWPSGNPEKWHLPDDGREKHQQRDRQQHEEDET